MMRCSYGKPVQWESVEEKLLLYNYFEWPKEFVVSIFSINIPPVDVTIHWICNAESL